MKIKKAALDNLKELQEIGARSYLPHYQHLWKPGGVKWYLEHCFGDDVLQNELRDSNIEYYIAADAAQNIGILKLVLGKPLPDSSLKNALHLEKIYFVAEHTGKGAGRQLIELAFERAKELNRECVWLMAMDTSEKPIAAYERAGFSFHARTEFDVELIKPEFRGMVILKKMLS